MTDTLTAYLRTIIKIVAFQTSGGKATPILMDNDAMINALRQTKKNMGIPLDNLDFAKEYRENKQTSKN